MCHPAKGSKDFLRLPGGSVGKKKKLTLFRLKSKTKKLGWPI